MGRDKKSANISKKALLDRLETLEKFLKKKEGRKLYSRRSRSRSSHRSIKTRRSRSRSSRVRDRDRGEKRKRNVERSRSNYESRHRSGSSSPRWPPSVECWNDEASVSMQRHSHVAMHTELNGRERSQSVVNSPQPRDKQTRCTLNNKETRQIDEGSNLCVRTPARSNSIEKEETPPLIISNDVDLTDDVLQILGEDPQLENKENLRLHTAICTRWANILVQNIRDEDRKLLCEQHKLPENLKTLNPPEINPEIVPHLSSYHKSRDAGYVILQKQLAHSLVALGRTLNILLTEGDKIPIEVRDRMLSSLWDSSRLQAGLFCKISEIRRTMIIQSQNKQFRDLTENTCPEKFLFGLDLGEKIKEAKVLENMGKNLFSPAPTSNARNKKTTNRGYLSAKRGEGVASYSGNQQRPSHSGAQQRPSYSGNQQRPFRHWREVRNIKGQQRPLKDPQCNNYRRPRK